ERLGEIVVGARPDGVDRRLHGGERGEDQHGGRRLERHQALERREPVAAGHAEIDQREIARLGLGDAHAVLAAAGGAHAVALAGEHFDEQIARDRIVVGDEEGGARHHARSPTGRSTRNVLPWPGSLVTSMRPWCSRTIWAEMKRPRPLPPFVEKNGSKIIVCSTVGIPRPVSLTASSTWRSRALVATAMRPPAGAASTALGRGFSTTCWSWFA